MHKSAWWLWGSVGLGLTLGVGGLGGCGSSGNGIGAGGDAGAGDGSTSLGDDGSTVFEIGTGTMATSIAVTPATATITSLNGKPATQAFTVQGLASDGSVVALSGSPSWSIA